MSLDSTEGLTYTVSGTENCTSASGDVVKEGNEMIVFLSFPSRDHLYQNVVRTLRGRGLQVLTNFDNSSVEGAERKTDMRLSRIRKSDAFVFFAGDANSWSPLREAEFGYAIGRGLAIAFVGKPFNSLHRYGDVFDSVGDFLATWYSDEYLERVSKWYPVGKGQAAVA